MARSHVLLPEPRGPIRKKLCSGALSILGSIIGPPCRHFTMKNDINIAINPDHVKLIVGCPVDPPRYLRKGNRPCPIFLLSTGFPILGIQRIIGVLRIQKQCTFRNPPCFQSTRKCKYYLILDCSIYQGEFCQI